LFKINDFDNQISENDMMNLNKSLSNAVERLDKSNNLKDNQPITNNNLNDSVQNIISTEKRKNKYKSIEVDYSNIKIDRDLFYKFKDIKNNELKHYCKIKNNNIEFRNIFIGGFSFEDKNRSAKVV